MQGTPLQKNAPKIKSIKKEGIKMEEIINKNKPTWTLSEVLNNAYVYKEKLQKYQEQPKTLGKYAFPFFADWKEIVVQYSKNKDLRLDNLSKTEESDFAKSLKYLRKKNSINLYVSEENIFIPSDYIDKETKWYVLLALDFISHPLEENPALFYTTQAHSYEIMWNFCIKVLNLIIKDLETIKFEWQGNTIELRDDESFQNFAKDILLMKRELEKLIKNQKLQEKEKEEIHKVIADLKNKYNELCEKSKNIDTDPAILKDLIMDLVGIVGGPIVVKWAKFGWNTLEYTYLKYKSHRKNQVKFLPWPDEQAELENSDKEKTKDLK